MVCEKNLQEWAPAHYSAKTVGPNVDELRQIWVFGDRLEMNARWGAPNNRCKRIRPYVGDK